MSKINSEIGYDVVVIGSGLGGLVSALLLAKEGYKVCVVEKNNQYGGNLQTFARDKSIFDTGVHYIGGLLPGQNLHTYFSYLNILPDLQLQQLDLDAFDLVQFAHDANSYPLAQGYDNFVAQLVRFFPDQEQALHQYIQDIKSTCNQFPLYNVQASGSYNPDLFELSLKTYLEKLTPNAKLRAVLCGNSFLYAGYENTPFYMHALIINSYIQSAFRCLNGGSQITRLLIKQLRKNNAELYKRAEVVKFEVENSVIKQVVLHDGTVIQAKKFISNIDPKTTLQRIGSSYFKKAYFNRIISLQDTVSSFSVFIKLKPNCVKYLNQNLYWHNSDADALQITGINERLSKLLLVMNATNLNSDYADSISILTYMDFDAMAPWVTTQNTKITPMERGASYAQFKTEITQVLINQAIHMIPELKNAIQSVYSASPLSYRDYIGGNKGNLYGAVKNVDNPLGHFIAPQSKIPNLYFTGQGVNMHGILGVTIGAVATCCEILGKEYLLTKIKKFA